MLRTAPPPAHVPVRLRLRLRLPKYMPSQSLSITPAPYPVTPVGSNAGHTWPHINAARKRASQTQARRFSIPLSLPLRPMSSLHRYNADTPPITQTVSPFHMPAISLPEHTRNVPNQQQKPSDCDPRIISRVTQPSARVAQPTSRTFTPSDCRAIERGYITSEALRLLSTAQKSLPLNILPCQPTSVFRSNPPNACVNREKVISQGTDKVAKELGVPKSQTNANDNNNHNQVTAQLSSQSEAGSAPRRGYRRHRPSAHLQESGMTTPQFSKTGRFKSGEPFGQTDDDRLIETGPILKRRRQSSSEGHTSNRQHGPKATQPKLISTDGQKDQDTLQTQIPNKKCQNLRRKIVKHGSLNDSKDTINVGQSTNLDGQNAKGLGKKSGSNDSSVQLLRRRQVSKRPRSRTPHQFSDGENVMAVIPLKPMQSVEPFFQSEDIKNNNRADVGASSKKSQRHGKLTTKNNNSASHSRTPDTQPPSPMPQNKLKTSHDNTNLLTVRSSSSSPFNLSRRREKEMSESMRQPNFSAEHDGHDDINDPSDMESEEPMVLQREDAISSEVEEPVDSVRDNLFSRASRANAFDNNSPSRGDIRANESPENEIVLGNHGSESNREDGFSLRESSFSTLNTRSAPASMPLPMQPSLPPPPPSPPSLPLTRDPSQPSSQEPADRAEANAGELARTVASSEGGREKDSSSFQDDNISGKQTDEMSMPRVATTSFDGGIDALYDSIDVEHCGTEDAIPGNTSKPSLLLHSSAPNSIEQAVLFPQKPPPRDNGISNISVEFRKSEGNAEQTSVLNSEKSVPDVSRSTTKTSKKVSKPFQKARESSEPKNMGGELWPSRRKLVFRELESDDIVEEPAENGTVVPESANMELMVENIEKQDSIDNGIRTMKAANSCTLQTRRNGARCVMSTDGSEAAIPNRVAMLERKEHNATDAIGQEFTQIKKNSEDNSQDVGTDPEIDVGHAKEGLDDSDESGVGAMVVCLSNKGASEDEYDLVYELITRLGGEVVNGFEGATPECVVAWGDDKLVWVDVPMVVATAIAARIAVVGPSWVVQSYQNGVWLPFEEFEKANQVKLQHRLFENVEITVDVPVVTCKSQYNNKQHSKRAAVTTELLSALRVAGAILRQRASAETKSSPEKHQDRISVRLVSQVDNGRRNGDNCVTQWRWDVNNTNHRQAIVANPAWAWESIRKGQMVGIDNSSYQDTDSQVL